MEKISLAAVEWVAANRHPTVERYMYQLQKQTINTMTRNHLELLQEKHLSLSHSLILYFRYIRLMDGWYVESTPKQNTIALLDDRRTLLINSTISKVKFILACKSFKISSRSTTFVIFFVRASVKRCV